MIGVMPLENRRFDSVRDSTLELFKAGEQPHIEFKSAVVINAVPKQVAAGANFVALQPAAGCYTIIFGVTEEDLHGSGATTGAIVGLQGETGGPADLDALQLQIEQTVHARVRPQPNISIYQENVATTPILVVEVRPASAPHLVDDRWYMRGVGGVRALTPGEALQIFKNQRLGAWIDEFADSDPLRRLLSAIRDSIDDLRFQRFSDRLVADADTALVSPQVIEASLGRLEDAISLAETKIDEAIDVLQELSSHAAATADNTSTPSAESVWWSVMRNRTMRLHTVHSFASQLGAERTGALDALVSGQLGETAPLEAYAENLAELAAYNTLRRGGGSRRSELDAASDLVTAVLWRRNGLPPTFGMDWLNTIQSAPDLLSDLRRPLSARDLIRDVEPEIGLLSLPGATAAHVAAALGATRSANERLLTVRVTTGAYRFAVPETENPWAVGFLPGIEVDDDAVFTLAQVAASIGGLVADTGGASWCIEGPGLAIPSS